MDSTFQGGNIRQKLCSGMEETEEEVEEGAATGTMSPNETLRNDAAWRRALTHHRPRGRPPGPDV